MIETCYVLEDGSLAHPRDVKRDAQGVLRHKDRRSVAYRPDGVTPRTRSVDVDALQKAAAEKAEAAKAATAEAKRAAEAAAAAAAKDMKPEEPKRAYKTRESKAD